MSTWWILCATFLLPSVAADTISPFISVTKSCYEIGEAIDATFGNAQGHEFIALYRRSVLANHHDNLPDEDMWVWTCDSQDISCTGKTDGVVSFNSNEQAWDQNWPLGAGSYRAVLAVEGNPAAAVAVSGAFTVGCADVNPAPAPSPTSSTPAQEDNSTPSVVEIANSNMGSVIADARHDIKGLINDNNLLIGKFLRLAFHDCVGECDGCVDMSNPDNAGLDMPIDALDTILGEYEARGLTRTDLWMLAAVVAADVAEFRVDIGFPFQWIGRKTCRELNNNDCGSNSCRTKSGPRRELCHGTAGTQTMLDFFDEEFGFNAQEVVAIMGAHSVGAMHRVNIGFEGPFGWDLTNDELDQGYFVELAGDGDTDPPHWRQVLVDNSDVGLPDRVDWIADIAGERRTMMNVDIGLALDIEEGVNMDRNGMVDCSFSGSNRCDRPSRTWDHVVAYSRSRTKFVTDFRDALTKMINNGYARDLSCPRGEVCVLKSNR